jgi:hypothetical protein
MVVIIVAAGGYWVLGGRGLDMQILLGKVEEVCLREPRQFGGDRNPVLAELGRGTRDLHDVMGHPVLH